MDTKIRYCKICIDRTEHIRRGFEGFDGNARNCCLKCEDREGEEKDE